MGTPEFASVSLSELISRGYEIAGVFTQPDKAKGRGMELSFSPVKELALTHGIPVFQPEKMRDGTALQILKNLKPDLVVVVAYGRILPDDLLAVPPLGTINVHGSLLPKYRGAAPIQWYGSKAPCSYTGTDRIRHSPEDSPGSYAGDVCPYAG